MEIRVLVGPRYRISSHTEWYQVSGSNYCPPYRVHSVELLYRYDGRRGGSPAKTAAAWSPENVKITMMSQFLLFSPLRHHSAEL